MARCYTLGILLGLACWSSSALYAQYDFPPQGYGQPASYGGPAGYGPPPMTAGMPPPGAEYGGGGYPPQAYGAAAASPYGPDCGPYGTQCGPD